MNCPKCDFTGIPDGARFCPQCGVTFASDPQPSTQISVEQKIGTLSGGKATGVEVGTVAGDLNVQLQMTADELQALAAANEKAQEEELSRSIAEVNSKDINERLAGIQRIDRLSKASDKHQGMILKALSTFIKMQAPWQPEVIRQTIERDVQLALEVFGRIPKRDNRGNLIKIEMPNVDISGANLANLDFEGVVLWGSNLRQVILARANLREADLGGVDFTEASLEMADLEGAAMWMCTPMPPVRPTIFDRTRMAGAKLKGAHLEAAILIQAIDLTRDQIRQAIINEHTRLPMGMILP